MTADPIPDINQTITAAVNARIEAEVVKALAGDEVIGQYVAAALQQIVEVPRRGSSYEKDRVTYLHAVLTKALQTATTDACTALILEEMPRIEDEVRKALRRNITAIAEGMATSMTQAASKGYGINVVVDLKIPKDVY
jgi:hypothetical protein